ncbi:hypothetical protein ACFY0G_32445 [Streptomyces sp. NPDC001552]|uniref:hypothetical protein n=1 Tax=Streptomyces sp. NPDC001552 TaxID=3364587 RepID=UPI0036A77B7B
MSSRFFVLSSPFYVPGPTFTATGLITVPARPATPDLDDTCGECGTELSPLIGNSPNEIRTWFCERCEFGS